MRIAVLVVALLVIAPFVSAQEAARDWDLHGDARTRTTMAYTEFSNGLGLGFRCQDGNFSAVVAGLPPSNDERRTIRLKFADNDGYETHWTSTTVDTVAIADRPAPLARGFRKGGALRMTLPGAAEGGRDLTYAVELPASVTAIDEVLTRCERPLTDQRDIDLDALPYDGLPRDIIWQTAPRPRFPINNYARGFAVVTCLADANGRARDCVVESEHPYDGRFGRATIEAMGQARLVDRTQPDAPMRPAMISFRANFVIQGFETDQERQQRREARQ